jgi:hypothetical protein
MYICMLRLLSEDPNPIHTCNLAAANRLCHHGMMQMHSSVTYLQSCLYCTYIRADHVTLNHLIIVGLSMLSLGGLSFWAFRLFILAAQPRGVTSLSFTRDLRFATSVDLLEDRPSVLLVILRTWEIIVAILPDSIRAQDCLWHFVLVRLWSGYRSYNSAAFLQSSPLHNQWQRPAHTHCCTHHHFGATRFCPCIERGGPLHVAPPSLCRTGTSSRRIGGLLRFFSGQPDICASMGWTLCS